MATVPREIAALLELPRSAYPTSDGRPMGETDLHRLDMIDSIETLELYFLGQPVYVTGNILLFYRRGNRRKHVSPDVMVVKGLDPHRLDNYLLWEERKPPNVVIEVTSKSTREEDLEDKFETYRDQVKVREYFLFDPRSEYLRPSLKGHRLVGAKYVSIRPLSGRLPSKELGLHLERHGTELRFWNPATGQWLPTLREAHEQAEAARRKSDQARLALEAENERLRREIEALKRRPS
jgi:Uma2 family endonuclease